MKFTTLFLICSLCVVALGAVNLKTGDGSTFEVEKSVANRASLLKALLANVDDGATVPLPIAQGEILGKAIEILNYVNEHSELQVGADGTVSSNDCFQKPLQSSEPTFIGICENKGLQDFVANTYFNEDPSFLEQLVQCGRHLGFDFMKQMYMMKSASIIRAKAETAAARARN